MGRTRSYYLDGAYEIDGHLQSWSRKVASWKETDHPSFFLETDCFDR